MEKNYIKKQLLTKLELLNMLKNIIHLFFPDYCPVCDTIKGSKHQKICTKCQTSLPLTYNWHKTDNELYKKLEGKCTVLYAASLLNFEHDGLSQKIIHLIKYKNRYDLGEEFGKYFGTKLKDSIYFSSIDYIVPLPLHKNKERERGYNQSYWISKGIAETLGIELRETLVERIVNNPPQAKLSHEQRQNNVKDIFSVCNVSELENKKILIVDDVSTTGSTIASLVKEINKKSPTTYVCVATLALTK